MRHFRSILLCCLLGAACATHRLGASEEPQASVRVLEAQPPVGTRLGPAAEIHVRAAYRLPEGASGHHASLMFLAENGATVTASGAHPVALVDDSGVVELAARPADVRPRLRAPLTAVVIITGLPQVPPQADTIVPGGMGAAGRERLPDSVVDSVPDQLRLIRVRSVVQAVARSRALFYNGAGPASGLRGPALPFEEVLAEYRSYGSEKAFALAADERGRRTWGYAFGYALADSAIARALAECERRVRARELRATCRVHAVGNTILRR